LVTVKAAMTLDGKIATRSGESKWITGQAARAWAMNLRLSADAVLVGINTILADDPQLTRRPPHSQKRASDSQPLRRIVLDASARTPLDSNVASDPLARFTTIVVGREAPLQRRRALLKRTQVLVAPTRAGNIDLKWLLKRLGSEDVASLLVEGGGEVNASFLLGGFAQRIAFFYAPKVLGGASSRKAVAGAGAQSLEGALDLQDVTWRRLGTDWLLTARVAPKPRPKQKP
jgi:diaminohydroxyphosphoribosylaminopyrimidine deaminase/5-amino-6-(5-phosphoribosylamino)uracil reductase